MKLGRFVCILTFILSLMSTEISWAQTLTKSFVPGEVIVKYKVDNNSKDFLSKASAAAQAHSKVISQKGFTTKTSWTDAHTFHYKIRENQKVSDIIQELRNDPAVEFAEPNYYVANTTSVTEAIFNNDEDLNNYIQETFGALQVESNSIPYGQTGAPIKVPESWQLLSPSGTIQTVAVIDSGVDITHRSLEAAIWVNEAEANGQAGVDDDGNGYVDDVNGWNFYDNNNNVADCNNHGTHVAGIVRGSTQDVIPTAGNYDGDIDTSIVKIMPVKFLGCDGVGTTSDAVNAIYYAVNNGAKILNNSWGGGAFSTALYQAILYAYQKNTLFVAAAGNIDLNIDHSPMYPASYPIPNVIAVAATEMTDYKADFSNYGTSVHIAAPGRYIMSAIPGGGHAAMSGTSMAAPFIAGTAAMMSYEKAGMIGYQLKTILLDSVDQPFVDTNYDGVKQAHESYKLDGVVQNSGRMNTKTSIQMTQSSSVDTSKPNYDPNSYLNMMRGPAAEGGGCGMVERVYNNYENSSSQSGGPTNTLSIVVTILLLLTPLVVALTMRQNTRYRRRYDRYYLGSAIQIHSGERAYLGSVGTISLGGLSFSSDAVLKLGHPLELNVMSPNGNDTFNVKGQVVWMSNDNSYGVKFCEMAEDTVNKISEWTKDLSKT